MSEKRIERKVGTPQEKKNAGSRETSGEPRSRQDGKTNRSSSTLSHKELEYALARPA